MRSAEGEAKEGTPWTEGRSRVSSGIGAATVLPGAKRDAPKATRRVRTREGPHKRLDMDVQAGLPAKHGMRSAEGKAQKGFSSPSPLLARPWARRKQATIQRIVVPPSGHATDGVPWTSERSRNAKRRKAWRDLAEPMPRPGLGLRPWPLMFDFSAQLFRIGNANC